MNLKPWPNPAVWMRYFKKNSIRRRLFLCFLSLVVLPLLFLGFISYFIATNSLEKNIILSSSEMVDQISQHLELYLRQYQQASLSALGNQFARDFLTTPAADQALMSYHMHQVRKYLFDPIISGNYEIEGIHLARLDGWVASVGKKDNRPVLIKNPRLLKEITWLNQLPRDGSMLVSEVQSPLFWQGSPVITLARRIAAAGDPDRILGIFWIELSLSKIQAICEQVRLGKSGYITIVDASGTVLYDPRMNFIGGRYPFAFRRKLFASSAGHFLADVEGIGSLVIYDTSPENWRLVAVVPYSEIASGVLRLKSISFLVILLCVGASILMSIAFAATITRPIIKLQRTMAEASKGYLDRVVPVESSDEVGRLTENFNLMLQKIQTLISDNYLSKIRQAEAESRQRHAELLALQAQINPHFLYNTLGTISSMAVLEGVDSISKMTETLSDFFRYSIHTGQMMVTLGDELAQVERYFAIQKIRFTDRIALDIQVPAELLSHPLIKLTIQPLVENACVHGLESCQQGRISVTAQSCGALLTIRVSDTGAGIPAAELQTLRRLLESSDASDSSGSRTGIGLRNVHSRLKLHYGSAFGLAIDSTEGAGTTVIVNIPFQVESAS